MLLNNFIDDSNILLLELLEHINNKNNKGIKHISHSLKGASGSLHLNDIYILSKDLESKSLDNNIGFNVFFDYYLQLKSLINNN